MQKTAKTWPQGQMAHSSQIHTTISGKSVTQIVMMHKKNKLQLHLCTTHDEIKNAKLGVYVDPN